MVSDFLREVNNYKLVDHDNIVRCYGISREPESGDCIMVMHYMKHGNLRQFLKNNKLDFKNKLSQLLDISEGLKSIHKRKLTHRDFHLGNILRGHNVYCVNEYYITDLGLSRNISEKGENKTYGVLPYVAPEVLRGELYTPSADIYSFGIMTYEIFSGEPPYCNYAHDSLLALRICEGLRPNLKPVPIPELLKSLIEKC